MQQIVPLLTICDTSSLHLAERTGSPSLFNSSLLESTCSLLHYGLATNLLAWSTGVPESLESLGAGSAAEGSPGGIPDQIWRSSCRALGAPTFLGSALALAGLQVPARYHHPPGARRSIDLPLLTPPATPPASARRAPGGGAFGGIAGGADWGDPRPAWQQQLERAHEGIRAASPPALRLLWALHMAAAAAAVTAEAAASKLDQEEVTDVRGAAGLAWQEAGEVGDLVMQLVSPAGQLLQAQLMRQQQWKEQGGGGAGGAAGEGVPDGLAASFCRVVQGWAAELLAACGSSDATLEARLEALLRLVLHLALAQPDPCQPVGCAAARALMRAAAAAGVERLHLLTPMLLQVRSGAAGPVGLQPLIVS